MKTTLLHLESHDNLVSIRDRMSWAKTPRILLVWPNRGGVDVRPLDLTLLRRHAQTLGAEVGLVTRDAGIWWAAREQKIPCFRTSKQAQIKEWQAVQPFDFPARRRLDLRGLRASLPGDPYRLNLAARVGVFAAGVLAVLLIVLLFLPSAEVHVTPPIREQSVTLPVVARADTTQVYLSGEIPIRRLTLDLQASASAPASGLANLPGAKAETTVEFKNLSDEDVRVPAGTILLTREAVPQAFETLGSVLVPARNEDPLTVRVRALTGGAAGNVAAEAISAFQSPLGLSLTVRNGEQATGGSDRRGAVPSDQDRNLLRANLLKKLSEQARVQISAELKAGDLLLADSVKLVDVLEEQFDPLPGAPADTLTLSLRARFEAAYATDADLRQLAAFALDAALPPGYGPRPGTLTVKSLSPPLQDADGLARWQVQAARSVQLQVRPAEALALVQGRTTRRAASLLTEAFDLNLPPRVSVRPLWWPWLPVLPFRISFSSGF
ncbi:MAG: baseplate J/gp47 family protein [Anaerolineae bacterium]|nr:baseplate J/gp47 family protein [Anaerolineae bacterium]